MNDMTMTAALTARGLVAFTMLRDGDVPERLGEISLRVHQRRAAARLIALIERHGGAMLAEPVGVGKTYTALGVAARTSGQILVVGPAALRWMWGDAAHRCGLAIEFASHEGLSRGLAPASRPEIVIVDEAHRARNTATRRYAVLAERCRGARVLLLTATPVQNSRDDLAAQLALFLGQRAWHMTDEELGELVVRDSGSLLAVRPALDGPHRVPLPARDECLDLLLALPAPIAAKNETVVSALLTYSLLHQWTSSRAALVASLRRRRSRGLALSAALEAGRRPTREELAAWTHGGDGLQLAFPELVAASEVDDDLDVQAMLVALDRHSAAIDALLRALERSSDPDADRAAALRDIRRRHPNERIIAFTHYAETVASLRSLLREDPGIAALTSARARVAGGRITREAVVEQFGGGRGTATSVRDVERIDLLITTDLLSEGLNLQEASVIVHLDLPWNPARLDQRVGRALRLGSRHARVTVYSIAPPADAERLLEIEARLREKLSVAQRTVGVAGRILPASVVEIPRAPGLAEQRSEVESLLRGWRSPSLPSSSGALCAAVAADVRGFLACVWDGRVPALVGDVGSGISTSTPVLRRAVAACEGKDVAVDEHRASIARVQLERWLAARQGSDAIDLLAASAARGRRATLTRVARALTQAPRHQRARFASLADAARAVATAPLGAGAERILETLAAAELPDEAWLRSIAAFGELNVRPEARRSAREQPRVIALILFG